MAQFIATWKQRARELQTQVYAMHLAYRDPRVPWYARIFAACVVAYAFSPIDLIPDPIPILGYLDDLVLIPLGVIVAVRMIPPVVLAECREQAREVMKEGQPVSRAAAAVIIAIWLCLAAVAVAFIMRLARK
jgi:uncharacterized membrane protein YkvA (DUF1232 family)